MHFAGCAWTELVFEGRAIPQRLALLLIAYAVVPWAAMALVGRAAWLQNGDPFAVAFGILARFAPTEVSSAARACSRDGGENCQNCGCFDAAPADAREWNLRPFG